MKRYIALGFVGFGLMVSPLFSTLATGAVPATPKIGVIDIERTLYETPAGKRANEAFEKNRTKKQKVLNDQQTELQKNSGDLQKQQSVLKPEVFAQKRAELEKKFIELQETYAKLERELAADRTKLVQDILKQATPIIQDIAKAEGLALIVDQSAVIWADPAVDLTAALNAKMK
jgi:outer membrane protein